MPIQSTCHTRADRLSGTVASVAVHHPETGFSVLRVKADGHRHQVTVVGLAAAPNAGEFVEARGTWTEREGKPQFRASELRMLPPRTTEGVVRLLGSGLIKGVGKAFARKLADHFGASLPDIIDRQPHLLEGVAGIGRARRQQLEASWAALSRRRDTLLFLASHGISVALAQRLIRIYGDRLHQVLRADPYCLAEEVDGIGFRKADAIARGLGISEDSPQRLRAAVLHAVRAHALDGNTAASAHEIMTVCEETIGLDLPGVRLDDALRQCLAEKVLVRDTSCDETLYLLPQLDQAERAVVSGMSRIARSDTGWPIRDVDAAILWVQEKENFSFSASQDEALRTLLGHRTAVLTGGPGTGKSTILRSLLRILEAKGVRFSLAAPTGRAARRMSEASGQGATTLHRLLGYNGRTRSFEYGRTNRLPLDLVVVDEASMLGLRLANRLVDAIPSGGGLLLLGDADQLPAIEPGAVLSDLIDSGVVPVSRLTEIHRQSAGSSIVRNAQLINGGIVPDLSEPIDDPLSEFCFVGVERTEDIPRRVLELCTEDLPRSLGIDPRRELQVLCPMHRGAAGTQALNRILQAAFRTDGGTVRRGDSVYHVGDKVIQTVNDHDAEIYNGDIGIVSAIDHVAKRMDIDFDGRPASYRFADLDNIQLAWASTIHKGQGSEWPVIVIPMAMDHFVMLDRRLLYTAVTRARSKLILVGQRQAVKVAVANGRSHKRRSLLGPRLQAAMAAATDVSPSSSGDDE